jgi:hypothetical protein
MKNLIMFIIAAIFLMSCGTTTGDPEVDTIGIGTAFGIVSKSFTYWLFIILALIPPIVYIGMYYAGKIDEVNLIVLFGFLALLMFAIFYRPAEIAANTSIAAFNRGNIIGY